jgi:hypothetical protein
MLISDFNTKLIQIFKLKVFLNSVDIDHFSKIFKLSSNELVLKPNNFVFLKNPNFLGFQLNDGLEIKQAYMLLSKLRHLVLSSYYTLSKFATTRHKFLDRRYSAYSPVEYTALHLYKSGKNELKQKTIHRFKFYVNFYFNLLTNSSLIFSRFNKLYPSLPKIYYRERIYRFVVHQSWVKQSSFLHFNSQHNFFNHYSIYNLSHHFTYLFWKSILLDRFGFFTNFAIDSLFSFYNFGEDFFNFFPSFSEKPQKSFSFFNKFFVSFCGYSGVFNTGRTTGLFLRLKNLNLSISGKYQPYSKSPVNFFKFKKFKIHDNDRMQVHDFGFYYPFSKNERLDPQNQSNQVLIKIAKSKLIKKTNSFEIGNLVSYIFLIRKIFSRRVPKLYYTNSQRRARSFVNSLSSSIFYNTGTGPLNKLFFMDGSDVSYDYFNFLKENNEEVYK